MTWTIEVVVRSMSKRKYPVSDFEVLVVIRPGNKAEGILADRNERRQHCDKKPPFGIYAGKTRRYDTGKGGGAGS